MGMRRPQIHVGSKFSPGVGCSESRFVLWWGRTDPKFTWDPNLHQEWDALNPDLHRDGDALTQIHTGSKFTRGLGCTESGFVPWWGRTHPKFAQDPDLHQD